MTEPTRMHKPQHTLLIAIILLTCHTPSWAQPTSPDPPAPAATEEARQTMLEYVQAGGVIGYVIIALSIVGVALVVEGFLRLKEERLIPPAMVEQAAHLAQRGRFSELLALAKTHESLFARIVAAALSQGNLGIEAVREGMRQQGEREVTLLRQRMGYVGFLAAIAPMLGLLGTVAGMIRSFRVLGEAKGSATPDELAVGIAIALVTTCMGLVIAVPLMFFHALFRDRVTRIGQKAAAECERLLRIMAVVVNQRPEVRGPKPEKPNHAAPDPLASDPLTL